MYFKKFDDLTFADHYIFEKVLQNKEICQELLERLLKIKIEHLEYPEIEKTISPYYETKGVRLDVYVKDSNKVFDIELQNANDVDIHLRTRYYQSMLDTNNLLKGEHYSNLPESFITNPLIPPSFTSNLLPLPITVTGILFSFAYLAHATTSSMVSGITKASALPPTFKVV